MEKQWFMRTSALVFVLSGLAIACGGGKKVAPKSPGDVAAATPAAHADVHERIAPHSCATRTKVAQLLGNSAPTAPAPTSDEVVEAAPPPTTSVAANTKLAGNQAYRVVAPGTVLIRTERGMGTGVVIDPKGYVLTNYHVIADGQKQDFVVKVNVTFGDLTPTGRMSRQEKTYDGVVVKADAVRDMAIVRVKDPPPKLTAVKLAKSAPQIAEKVISVGHAGIGFLWAAKTCNVASIGERQQDASILASLDCTRTDPAQSAEEASRVKKSCDERKKQMADAFLAQTQGLAVQTDCAITHGDSGGPLVNAAGEIVGLNQSISADLATASFHVHLDEIREFSTKYGEEGIPLVPDPYCDGGFNPTLEDIDLDGIPDTLVTKGGGSLFGGYDRMGILMDLDQDHFKKKKEPLEPFDAEVALLIIRDTAYIWYDTDNDNRFDLLLVDKDNDGKPEVADRIDAEGHIKEDKEALPKHDFAAKLVADTSLHARLGKIATAVGGARYTSNKLTAASKALSVPDALLGGGSTGRLVDSDRNGKPDLVFVRGAFSRGLLIDADEDSLGSLKPGDPADDLLKAKKVDAEISVIVQGNTIWAQYDTDNDAKFDLALMTTTGTDESSLFTTSAWRLGAGGEMTLAPEHIGRKLLRPGLVAFPRAAGAFRAASYDFAADEAMGSLPDPLTTKGRFKFREVKGFPKGTVIEAQSLSSSVMLVDLDRDTKLPPKDESPDRLVRDGKLDAEVAIVHRGTSDWIYYDTDGDNKFDLVLFVPTSGQEPTQAYRFAKGATALEPDAKSIAGRPLRNKSVFKDKALATKWKTLAAKMFKATSIEE
jgi:S1-C subfamily serine protease